MLIRQRQYVGNLVCQDVGEESREHSGRHAQDSGLNALVLHNNGDSVSGEWPRAAECRCGAPRSCFRNATYCGAHEANPDHNQVRQGACVRFSSVPGKVNTDAVEHELER
jgi:hypothetical protein